MVPFWMCSFPSGFLPVVVLPPGDTVVSAAPLMASVDPSSGLGASGGVASGVGVVRVVGVFCVLAVGAAGAAAPPWGIGPGGKITPAEGSPPGVAAAGTPLADALAAGAADLTLSPTIVGPPDGTPV